MKSKRISTERTHAIINSNPSPVSDFVQNTDIDFRYDEIRELIKKSTKEITLELDSNNLSYKFFGNTINANMIQKPPFNGLIPLRVYCPSH